MFPRPHNPTSPAGTGQWRTALRHALDVVVAFATLADADADESAHAALPAAASAPARPATSHASAARTPVIFAVPPATAAGRARTRALLAGPPDAPPAGAAGRDGGPRAGAAPSAAGAHTPHRGHPHRRALPAPARSRRPGAVRAAPQPCLTPLPVGHTGRGRTPLVPSR